jgi:sugar phosphate isomerase/epimerase
MEDPHYQDFDNPGNSHPTASKMKDSLKSYIKPGILQFMAYPVADGNGPVVESLERILTDAYFDVVEVSWVQDPEVRTTVGEMLACSGVSSKYALHPRILARGLDLNSLDETERLKATEEAKEGISEASEMGIREVGFLSGPYPGDHSKNEAMDQLEKSVDDLCRFSLEREISLGLEVFDRSVDKKCLIGPVDDAREFAARIAEKHQNFGLVVDLSHIPLLGESPAEALTPVADYVSHIHIGNCYIGNPSDPAYGDKHPRFGYPGGENDVKEITEFLRVLFEIGYLAKDGSRRGEISFEIKPVDQEDPELTIANAKRKLAAAWAALELSE